MIPFGFGSNLIRFVTRFVIRFGLKPVCDSVCDAIWFEICFRVKFQLFGLGFGLQFGLRFDSVWFAGLNILVIRLGSIPIDSNSVVIRFNLIRLDSML